MKRYLVLAQSALTARALRSWLELLCEETRAPGFVHTIVSDRPIRTAQAGIEAYERLMQGIEKAARGDDGAVGRGEVVVLIDQVQPHELDATSNLGWDQLIAMLILSFPDLYWVFGCCAGADADTLSVPVHGAGTLAWKDIGPHHQLSSLLQSAIRDPLFDSTGLRNWVRAVTNEGLRRAGDDLKLAIRQPLAAAIDEERRYAYLHAYAAYRFGCRADVITRWSAMKDRFSGEGPHDYWLLFEDMSLNFVDRSESVHLLRLGAHTEPDGIRSGREHYCPKLRSIDATVEPSQHRLLITTGQSREGPEVMEANREYLRNKGVGHGDVIIKPVSGLFDLWSKAGLLKQWPCTCRIGNVPYFVWPPQVPQPRPDGGGHGAPGKLLLLTDTLIRRAREVLPQADTADRALQGAVLATDALELIGNRTPTSAFEALGLKHELELHVECQFAGVGYHLLIEPRIREIELECDAISQWFVGTRERKTASLNAQLKTLGRLISILRSFGQFDEEQRCMDRARRLHNELWTRQRRLGWLLTPLLGYMRLLLKSFPIFLCALGAWIAVLTTLFMWANGNDLFLSSLSDAVSAFFSQGPPYQDSSIVPPAISGTAGAGPYAARRTFVVCIAIVSGSLHLGVFLSHLYSIVRRHG
jgi:hypothetical protein